MPNELTIKEQNLPVSDYGFEQDAGAGLENTTAQDFSIPYLTVLQKGSPQVDTDSPSRLEGAAAGMLFNTATEELFNKDSSGVLVVPALFEKVFIEWRPRDQGGGLAGIHAPDSDIVKQAIEVNGGVLDRNLCTSDGNDLRQTARFYCVLVDLKEATVSNVIVAMASTQVKKSKQWLTKASEIRLKSSKGGLFNPPLFSHLYRLTTVAESNEKGTWRGWKINKERVLNLDDPFEAMVYNSAKTLKELVQSGVAKAADTYHEPSTDDIPF